MPSGSGQNAHLDSLEGRYWMRLEWRARGASVLTEISRNAHWLIKTERRRSSDSSAHAG